MFLNIRYVILFISVFFISIPGSMARDNHEQQVITGSEKARNIGVIPIDQTENNWLTQAQIEIAEQGMIETVLPPGLHRAVRSSMPWGQNSPLDLCLLGPDGKPRAFELFWREEGETEKLALEASSIELLDDKRLVWEGVIHEKLNIEKVTITIADNSYVGKVDIQGQGSSGWKWLAKNAALYKTEKTNQATVNISGGEYNRLRLYFSGYDKEYQDTPVFVDNVQIEGERSGRDYIENIFRPVIEEQKNDQTLEIRAILPGSGIWIDEIEITTSALFKGVWRLGLESIIMGKQDFNEFKNGTVSFIKKGGQSFSLSIGSQMQGRFIILKLESQDYFGKIEDFKVKARLPRMVFFADQEGVYTARTGWGKISNILEKASDSKGELNHVTQFSQVETNRSWRPESMVEDYAIKGGPFDKKGFTWKAGIHVDSPGFYRLLLNEKANLELNRTSLRIVKDNIQIPYFIGRKEIREVALDADIDYDEKNNGTLLNLKLPYASSQWLSLQLTSQGIFKRRLVLEKHEPGKAGWQPWTTLDWVNDEKEESLLTIGLNDFPSDQAEIRVIIDHGNNEPITIKTIQALYYAQDLLFLASKTGAYELMGGNPVAPPISYDLSIVQDDLLSIMPKQIEMASIEPLKVSKEIDNMVEKGGPFDSNGYTWISHIPIDRPGFYRLMLNQRASLEENRSGLRLVKNGSQVPYFIGDILKRKTTPEFETEYIRKENKTVCIIKLPYESPHWHSIQLTAKGVFNRNLVFEVPKPGKAGWQPWKSRNWSNNIKGDANLEVMLNDFPRGETDIRIVIEHGDNHPLEINKLHAVYATQDFFFLAEESGEYELVGGNSKATAASYDLELLQNNLLKSEPIKIEMKEIEPFKAPEWETRLNNFFSEQGWGLYAVLGAVTIILLVIIVRLFPQEESEK